MAKKYSEIISANLSIDQLERLDNYAKHSGMTRSEIIRTLIENSIMLDEKSIQKLKEHSLFSEAKKEPKKGRKGPPPEQTKLL